MAIVVGQEITRYGEVLKKYPPKIKIKFGTN
jgi:hypothetical protein